jgi:YjbE family integral membrane protein
MFSLSALAAFAQIVLIDISLAGDNAIAVGMAAAGLPHEKRRRAILAGIVAATILRIAFAIFAVQLLHVIGLMLAGGLLLLWVTWKMYRDLRKQKKMVFGEERDARKTIRGAILQIVIADISMSLDNVLAVASVARDHIWTLVAGLGLSVILMGAAASLVAKLVERYRWIGYAGVAVVFYAALSMIWDGMHQIAAL